ncbi:DUF6249 domain-containing protein [Candidatus Aminicenantes bacterium AH-873-B07]|jgi:hypothetical protein|nr:DUF6249 domain-containing protein [Candidatus Aminicenantes bacterium AH-873-B07]
MGWTFLIPIIGIIGGCLIAIFAMYFKYKERKLRQAERLAAIEKGMPLPPEPEEEKTIEERKRGLLTAGFITLFTGIGIFISFFFLSGFNVASIGFIPFAIGMGMILSSLLMKEKKEEK